MEAPTFEKIPLLQGTNIAFRSKCTCCFRRRMCVLCDSCGERVCRPCAPLSKDKVPVPVCEACREEAQDYAAYGYRGAP